MARPLPGRAGVYRLPGGDRLLRVRGGRRPAAPEVSTPHGWHRLDHPELVKLVSEELRRHTGLSNHELPAEMLDSRDAVAALLAARARATPSDDPYLRSEQSLVTGHPHHPAPPRRAAAARPPAGCRTPPRRTPASRSSCSGCARTPSSRRRHLGARRPRRTPARLPAAARPPLAARPDRPRPRPRLRGRRLIRLDTTASPVWPTAAIRTVYAPERDLFLKFSLDVRITNDVRRLWRHDLLRLRRTDAAVRAALAGGPAAWLSDRGYRTADFAFEELAVLVRDGVRGHVPPGATPFLAAGLVEGFAGSPLDGPGDPGRWWGRICARWCPRCSRPSPATASSWRRICRTRWSPVPRTGRRCGRCSGTRRA
ncbi:hypothetical protein GCM10020295_16410 [Streptomyces cinereospinus]